MDDEGITTVANKVTNHKFKYQPFQAGFLIECDFVSVELAQNHEIRSSTMFNTNHNKENGTYQEWQSHSSRHSRILNYIFYLKKLD